MDDNSLFDDAMFGAADLDPDFDPFEGFASSEFIPNPHITLSFPNFFLVPEKRQRASDDENENAGDENDNDQPSPTKKAKTGEAYESPYAVEEYEHPVPFLRVPPEQVEASCQNFQSQLKAMKFRADKATSERNHLRSLVDKLTAQEDGVMKLKELAAENTSLRRVMGTRKTQLDAKIAEADQLRAACEYWKHSYSEANQAYQEIMGVFRTHAQARLQTEDQTETQTQCNQINNLNAPIQALSPPDSAASPVSVSSPASAQPNAPARQAVQAHPNVPARQAVQAHPNVPARQAVQAHPNVPARQAIPAHQNAPVQQAASTSLSPQAVAALAPQALNSLPPQILNLLSPQSLALVSPRTWALVSPRFLSCLSPRTFLSLSAQALNSLSPQALGVISARAFNSLPSQTLGSLSSETVSRLSANTVDSITPQTLASLSQDGRRAFFHLALSPGGNARLEHWEQNAPHLFQAAAPSFTVRSAGYQSSDADTLSDPATAADGDFDAATFAAPAQASSQNSSQNPSDVIDLTDDTSATVSTQTTTDFEAESTAKSNSLTQFHKKFRAKEMNWLRNRDTASKASDRLFRRLNPHARGAANINIGTSECISIVATQDAIRNQLGGPFKKAVTRNNYYYNPPTPGMDIDSDYDPDEDAPFELDEEMTIQACHTEALVNVNESHAASDGYDDDELLRLMEEELSRD